jgi:hypothetical protein
VAEESLDEEAREGRVRRGGGCEEQRGQRVVPLVEADEVRERVGEQAGGGERGRKECKVGRRGLERWREREDEAEGSERVGVSEEGEQTGEVYGLGVVRDGGEVGGDQVDHGDVGVGRSEVKVLDGMRDTAVDMGSCQLY